MWGRGGVPFRGTACGVRKRRKVLFLVLVVALLPSMEKRGPPRDMTFEGGLAVTFEGEVAERWRRG